MAKPNKTPRQALLAKLRQQAERALARGRGHLDDELGMLAYFLRYTPQRKMHVTYQNIRFPIRHAFAYRAAICPETGMSLVMVLDI